jgi:hypothetical protein
LRTIYRFGTLWQYRCTPIAGGGYE